MGAQNEPRGGSAPLGPPRGYATGAFNFACWNFRVKDVRFLFAGNEPWRCTQQHSYSAAGNLSSNAKIYGFIKF